MKKRILSSLMALVMAFSLLPASALAALNTGHKIDVTFTVLYVDDEFRIGYSYGASEKTQFVCQYTTSHSDTAYNNHTIAISDIKAAAERATVNNGYSIVGWSKQGNANPTIWGFDLKEPTACNKGTTIYLVAKKPTPSAPTKDQIPTIITGNYVTVSDKNNVHAAKSYPIVKEAVTKISAVSNNQCTVTISNSEYIKKFVADSGNVAHESDGASSYDVTLKYDSGKWGLSAPTNITFNVKCDPAPEIPSKDDFQTVGGAGFIFKCVNSKATHPWKGEGTDPKDIFETTLQNHPDAYKILQTKAQKDNNGRYYFDVEAETAPYLPDYYGSSFAGIQHELAENAPEKVTLRFYWSETDGWKQDKENMPVVEVTCKNFVSVLFDANTTDAVSDMPDDLLNQRVDSNGYYTFYFPDSANSPQRKGYEFKGWSSTPTLDSFSKPYAPGTGRSILGGNIITYYCIWEPVQSTIPAPTKDDFSEDTEANKILIKCDNTNVENNAHDVKLAYNDGSYTIAWAEGSKSCTLTFDVDSYVTVYNANTQRPAHTAVANQTVTMTASYNSTTKKWKVDDVGRPEIHVTCEPVVDPTKPDEDKLYKTIDDTQVVIQCETRPNDHPSMETKISTVDSTRSGIQITYSGNGTVATVTITNPKDYAAVYTVNKVTHKYKEDGSRLTFTLEWRKDDVKGWDWYLTGASPLINTTCEVTPEKYTVRYDLNDGKGASGVSYDAETVAAGTEITVKAAPTRSGYTFKGWKAGSTTYQPGKKVTVNGAMTFTAQWSKDSSRDDDDDDDDYTLRYVTNGGKAISSESKSRSWVKDYEDLPVPTRVGYRFDGWYYDTKLTKAVTGDVKVNSGTVTLYAGWTENSVPAILNGDDHFAYIQGYDDGTVRPNTPVTRAQVATILFRLLDEDVRDEYLTETNTFTDVAADYWANTAISTMANLGVFKGRTADRFDPNAPITRGEFAAVCARFDDSSVRTSDTFSDIDGYWAKQEILRAAALGWVQGYQDGTFRPTASITRAQVVTMINRVLCRQPETASDLLKGMTTFTDCAEGDWCYLAIQEAANSHDYVGKSGSIYERWTDLNKAYDWSRYEH